MGGLKYYVTTPNRTKLLKYYNNTHFFGLNKFVESAEDYNNDENETLLSDTLNQYCEMKQ